MATNYNTTIERLENDYWGDAPKESSGLVNSCHELRRKLLSEFEPNDIRILIGQSIGLDYIVPIAIDVLEKEPFIEALYFEGDLLKNVMKVDEQYWNNNQGLRERTSRIFKNNRKQFSELDMNKGDKEMILQAYHNVIKNANDK